MNDIVHTIKSYYITEHARFEMKRRGIKESEVDRVLSSPGQVEEVRDGRLVYQSKMRMGTPHGKYLLRVFVDIDREPAAIVTAYRTSKIHKYWKN
ncbi:conserved hypothetical protein [Candidatus Desulfarcum epimagneticum]|uniref:DUF4258 domain-containing protein n=1 Tax=uncultured Desulfobacteraceae bacterium TaxID=218296 RepID=A0A484HLA1_9BACT|nr:conserved hypothetical protein [uncultured Desulfobacteraceae bacterium]